MEQISWYNLGVRYFFAVVGGVVTVRCVITAASGGEEVLRQLDYEEITPCLKQVTVDWADMLNTPSRKNFKFDRQRIENAVRSGLSAKICLLFESLYQTT